MVTDADFSEYMKQIDDVSEQAEYMEKICSELDDYTKYLGKSDTGAYSLRHFHLIVAEGRVLTCILVAEDKLKSANRART